MIKDAISFAVEAHSGQIRKFDGTAYIRHPMSVMGMLSAYTDCPHALSAAVLHDTVEDCKDVTIEVIHERFGELVASYVFYATEISSKEDGPRAYRKVKDAIHYSRGTSVSQTIKVIDAIDNIPSMFLFDREFGIKYIKEKLNMLEHLQRADDTAIAILINLIEKLDKL